MLKGGKHENAADLLVLLLQTLEDDPFEKLIEICEPITYSLTSRYYFPDYEREDFIQEARSVLVESVQKWKFDKGMPFIQYYHMQLSNHLNMLVRKNRAQKRRVNLETTSLDDLVEDAGIHLQGTSPVTTYPEEATIAKETLNKYLVELSPFESEVFWLFINGQSQEQITVELSGTLEQVRNALYRCSMKLRHIINL